MLPGEPAANGSLDAAIVEQIAEALIYCDRHGIIERWNRAAADVFGFAASEAIGQRLDLIIPEHLRAAHWRGFDAAVARGSTRLHGRASRTRGLHKSGRRCYVEMSFALVFDAAGAVRGAVAVARDVTDAIGSDRRAPVS